MNSNFLYIQRANFNPNGIQYGFLGIDSILDCEMMGSEITGDLKHTFDLLHQSKFSVASKTVTFDGFAKDFWFVFPECSNEEKEYILNSVENILNEKIKTAEPTFLSTFLTGNAFTDVWINVKSIYDNNDVLPFIITTCQKHANMIVTTIKNKLVNESSIDYKERLIQMSSSLLKINKNDLNKIKFLVPFEDGIKEASPIHTALNEHKMCYLTFKNGNKQEKFHITNLGFIKHGKDTPCFS